MKKYTIALFTFLLLSHSLSAQNDPPSGTWFNHIKLGTFAGFKAYGVEEEYFQLKDQSLTTLYLAEIAIYSEPNSISYSIYGEYINQPMMSKTASGEGFTFQPIFRNTAYLYEAFIRSRGYTLGSTISASFKKNWDIGLKMGAGQTYNEVREYLTDKSELSTTTLETRDTMTNFSIGMFTHYTLPNNIGLYAEAAFALKVPVFRAGFTYTIKSK